LKKFHKNLLEFEEVIGDLSQSKALYELLKKREFKISSHDIPTMKTHHEFVSNHPYRVWYLIKNNGRYIGSTYLLDSNCLGISVPDDQDLMFDKILNFMISNHSPLSEIKSVRPANFYINIPPNHEKVKFELENLGAKKIQITYSLENLKEIN